MVFWFRVAPLSAGLLFVPLLTIGTHGHSTRTLVASLGAGNIPGKEIDLRQINVDINEKRKELSI